MAQLLRLSALSGSSSSFGGNRFLLPAQGPSFPAAAASFPAASPSPGFSLSLSLLPARSSVPGRSSLAADLAAAGGGGGVNDNGRGGSGGGGGDGSSGDRAADLGPLGIFVEGWRSRVSADPQFPFKVLMEEIVGVSSCVLGDMASRPNFGLNELDFVFSTLVVGSILNFVLMYLLAPTAATGGAAVALPGLFASCPPGHMFQPGAYSMIDRLGTFVYKGSTFACVGFAAGLAGTAISNGLIALRKKMDPAFDTPNKPPPTVLNALTWAIHMGLSSNLRYQTLNGAEFLMASALPAAAFKGSVVVLRCLNNVLGGVSFVTLARLTGSQKTEENQALGGEEEDDATTVKLLQKRVNAIEPEAQAAESAAHYK